MDGLDSSSKRPEREFVAATVEQLRLERARSGGRLPPHAVGRAAKACDVAPSTMLRYLAQGLPRTRGPAPWIWEGVARAAYFRAAGNVKLARALLVAEGAGEGLPSEATMYRAALRDFAADERALAREGERAARGKRLVCAVEQRYRNEVWLADHKLLDVAVVAPRAVRAQRLWMTAIIDGYSRRAVGASLSTTPNRGHVFSALGMAIRQCGLPETLVFDRGREFLATSVSEHAAALDYRAIPTAAYSPHLKGKIERLHQTLNRRFAAALGTVPAPAIDRRAKPLIEPPAAPSMSFAIEQFFAVLQEYNATPHSALGGRSPNETYQDDPTPERSVDPAVLRRFLLASSTRKVTEYGVKFQTRTYYAPELEGRRGETVEIRWAQDDLRALEIYRGRRYWCTANLVDPASPQQHQAVMAGRQEHAERRKADLRLARRQARERWKAIGADGHVQATTPVTAAEYYAQGASAAASNLTLLANLGLETDLESP